MTGFDPVQNQNPEPVLKNLMSLCIDSSTTLSTGNYLGMSKVGVFKRLYFYIQNIFLGEDIRRQLPKESAEFDDINGKWKMIMTHLNKVKNVYRGTHQPGMSTCHLSARYICIHSSQLGPFCRLPAASPGGG